MSDSHSDVPNVKNYSSVGLSRGRRDWYCYQHLDTDQHCTEFTSMDVGRTPYHLRCWSQWLCYFEIQRCEYHGSA